LAAVLYPTYGRPTIFAGWGTHAKARTDRLNINIISALEPAIRTEFDTKMRILFSGALKRAD